MGLVYTAANTLGQVLRAVMNKWFHERGQELARPCALASAL